MNLELRKFNIQSIKPDKVCVFIGKRETGKSFLVKDLLYHHRKIPVGTVISGTEAANPFYSTMVPSIFIHDQYSPEIINHALKRQKLVVRKQRKEQTQFGGSNIDPNAFLILDDCYDDRPWIKDHVRSLFMNGRHCKILFIITCSMLYIPFKNIDYVLY